MSFFDHASKSGALYSNYGGSLHLSALIGPAEPGDLRRVENRVGRREV
jgi:hypothetical protein